MARVPRSRPRKLVAAALIVEGDRVLLSRRRADQAHPGQWEFPGGKLEEGESPAEALRRELVEELSVTAEVGRAWDVVFHRYPEFDVLMLLFVCRLPAGAQPRCREVAEIAWSSSSALADFDILPADAPIVTRLVDEGVPAFISGSVGRSV